MWQQRAAGPAPQQQTARPAPPAPLGLAARGLLQHPKSRTPVRTHCQPLGQQQQQAAAASPATLLQQITPSTVARTIQARRSVVDDEALHRPLGLVAFGAYVLGSAASLVGACWGPMRQGGCVSCTCQLNACSDASAHLPRQHAHIFPACLPACLLPLHTAARRRATLNQAQAAHTSTQTLLLLPPPTDMPGPAWLPTVTGAVVGGVFATLNRYCSARLWRPPASPLNVVVTGSTRGLGKALARELLAHGDSVVITGR